MRQPVQSTALLNLEGESLFGNTVPRLDLLSVRTAMSRGRCATCRPGRQNAMCHSWLPVRLLPIDGQIGSWGSPADLCSRLLPVCRQTGSYFLTSTGRCSQCNDSWSARSGRSRHSLTRECPVRKIKGPEGHAASNDRPNHLALPHRRETRRRRDGCGVQS